MIEALHQALRDVKRRAMMAVGRAVLAAIDDTTKAQSLQLELLDGETADDVERFQNYGFTSVPYAGAEAVAVAVGGLRSHMIVVAVEDRRYRLTGLANGEVAIFDDQGQKAHLQRAGILITTTKTVTVHGDVEVKVTGAKVTVQADNEVDVTAPKVVVTSNDVELGGSGGKKVVLDGDPVVGGVVQASSTKVTAL